MTKLGLPLRPHDSRPQHLIHCSCPSLPESASPKKSSHPALLWDGCAAFLSGSPGFQGWPACSSTGLLSPLPASPGHSPSSPVINLQLAGRAAGLSSSNYWSCRHNKSWSHKCRQIRSHSQGRYCALGLSSFAFLTWSPACHPHLLCLFFLSHG